MPLNKDELKKAPLGILQNIIVCMTRNPDIAYYMGQAGVTLNILAQEGLRPEIEYDLNTPLGVLKTLLNIERVEQPKPEKSLAYTQIRYATEALEGMRKVGNKDHPDYNFMKGRFSAALETFTCMYGIGEVTKEVVDEIADIWMNNYVVDDQIEVLSSYLKSMEEAISHE